MQRTLPSLSRSACPYRRCSVLVLAKKQSKEAREKKAARRQFEQKQRDKKLHTASTQHTDVWYENSAGGLWVEHRRSTEDMKLRAKQKEARQGQAPYSPTMKELLRGSSAQQRKPPALVESTLWTQLQLPSFNSPTRRMLQIRSGQQQQQSLPIATPPSTQNITVRARTAGRHSNANSIVTSQSPRDINRQQPGGSDYSSGSSGSSSGGSGSSTQLYASAQSRELWGGQAASSNTPLHALRQWELQPSAWINPNTPLSQSQRGYGQPDAEDDMKSSFAEVMSHPLPAIQLQPYVSLASRANGTVSTASVQHSTSSSESNLVDPELMTGQQSLSERSHPGFNLAFPDPHKPTENSTTRTDNSNTNATQPTKQSMPQRIRQPGDVIEWTDEDLGGYAPKRFKKSKVRKLVALQGASDKGVESQDQRQEADRRITISSSPLVSLSDTRMPDDSDW